MSEQCITNCSLLETLCNDVFLNPLSLDNNGNQSNATSPITHTEAYGYGFIMILIISLTSLLGVVIIPFIQHSARLATAYRNVITLLIATGVGALVSDALLHLIPSALDKHQHGNVQEDNKDERDVIWKMCGVLCGMVSFFSLELLLHTCFKQHGHSHSHRLVSTVSGSSLHSDVALLHDDTHSQTSTTEHRASNGQLSCSDYGTVDNNTHAEQEGSHWSHKLVAPITSIKPLAWVIIIGDSLHNLTDGLAVGVAISQSLGLGLSTAIAILFHEIPHELSDYAILLHTGMSWYKALLLNLISTLTAFVGFFVGVAIGTESKKANEWLLAVIAGQFLYIALVDLLPEVLHAQEKGLQRMVQVVMTFIGLSLGFTILLLIALFEDSIDLSLP